nr:hypothetical protein [Sahlingia subintegra]
MNLIAKLFFNFYLDFPSKSDSVCDKKLLINFFPRFIFQIDSFSFIFKIVRDTQLQLFMTKILNINEFYSANWEKEDFFYYYFVCLEYRSNIIIRYLFLYTQYVKLNSLKEFFEALDYNFQHEKLKDEEVFEWKKYIF